MLTSSIVWLATRGMQGTVPRPVIPVLMLYGPITLLPTRTTSGRLPTTRVCQRATAWSKAALAAGLGWGTPDTTG